MRTMYTPVVPGDEELAVMATAALRSLGVPPNLRGYGYLREAIIMYAQSSGRRVCITKDVYPALARRHVTTAGGVERAIRHAIASAWNRRREGRGEGDAGAAFSTQDRPCNAEFISTIAEGLQFREDDPTD